MAIPVLALAFLSIFSALAPVEASTSTQCCTELGQRYEGKVIWPGTPEYIEEALLSYWSNTSRLHPACVFTPASVADVSEAIQTFERNECTFAVRGGGHTPNRGAANTDGGVLLSSTRLDELTLHEGYVSVGAGLRWGAVFDFLEPEGLAVVGGRVGRVGVAGLTLGCGLSAFSGKRGFACDNVKAFQIVVAGGTILEASASSHADLFWALKGGSNNFGVVTRFDLYTHSDYKIYTGTMSLDMKHFDELAVAIDKFVRVRSEEHIGDNMAIAPKTQWVPIFGPPTIELPLGSTTLPSEHDCWSRHNQSGIALPPGLSDFANLPFNYSTSRNMTVRSAADSIRVDVLDGLRFELRVVSFRSTVDMIIGIKNIFEEEFDPVFQNVPGFSGVMEFQPITKRNIREGIARGGNALGITEDRGPMIWVVMANSWLNEEDDQTAQAAGQRVVDKTQDLARRLGLYEPFLFLNDAGVGQDPISTYGEESIRKLLAVRQKYDNKETFTRLQTGGFKLPRL